MSTNNPMSNIPPLGPPTGMMPGGAPSKFKPIDPLRVLRANWLWIVLAMFVGVILGGGVWFGLNRFVPEYTSEAQFRVNTESIDPTRAIRMAELEPIIITEVQTIIGLPILRDTLNAPSVQQTPWFAQFDNDFELALQDMSDNVIKANHIRETQLFEVRATTKNEDDAQIILTALRDEYIRLKRNQEQSDSSRDMQAAQSRLNAANEEITSIRASIKRFLENTPIETLEERTSRAAQEVQRLVYDKSELEKLLNSLDASYQQLLKRQQEGDFDPSDEERAQIEMQQEIMTVDSQLRDLRVARQTQLRKYGENHEVIRDLDERILATERERRDEFDNQARILFNAKLEQAALGMENIKIELSKVTQSLDGWTATRQDNVRKIDEYQTLQRELETAEEERKMAQTAIQELLLEEGMEKRVVVEQAYAPQQAEQTFPPDWYVTIPIVTAVFTALITGLIFLRELMDQRVRSAADVKMVSDASLVGLIPSADQDRRSGRQVERVVEQQPAGLLAESFRQVRTAVLSKMDRRGYKTLMVVSAKPGAGVTAVAQNLAASCALSGRRVLVIDANFRKPGVAQMMGVPNQPGLADLLCGDHDIDAAVELAHESSTQGLSILPAGDSAKAAVELFENPRFRELMGRLESEYDLLIIDTPPALLASDAQLLSRHVDAMLLVSRARTDTRGMLQRLYRELDGQRADILGIVLNGVQASAGGYLKRNFREFHAYAGPDRRNAQRAPQPAAAPAPQPVAAGAADRNGDTVRIEPPIEDAPIADDDDDDILGGFDMDDEDTHK
ncbi:MAG: polysaccharide biosynthesis tyrosine autokinase [Phycisphaeraceae bacterium]